MGLATKQTSFDKYILQVRSVQNALMTLRTAAVALLICSFAASAVAEIDYRVSVDADNKLINVEMTFAPTEATTSIQMPSFMPGAYMKADFWRNVTNVSALDSEGHVVTPKHDQPDTWTFDTKNVKSLVVSYSVPAGGGFFGPSDPKPKAYSYGGPSVYMYVVGRKTEPSAVSFDVPSDWLIGIGLNPSPGSKGKAKYLAKTYDVLADNPVTMGHFTFATYKVGGKEHLIALRGKDIEDVDMERLKKATQFVSEAETDFFGGPPYDRYVWHFALMDRADGAGGLEHLSSTQISLAPSVGPRAVSVFAHEFFHLWNVKRIRSSVLGPFDYTKVPETGALWWLEGVTDYYASHLLHRYGWDDDARYYGDIIRNVDQVRGNKGRLEVSPYDSSFRVKEANNSQGYKVSYYPTGWLLGMLFDIELRSRTGGKHSLDDVEHALWQLCRNDQPGFQEGEIRNQLVRFGGAEMGPIYDKWVMSPGELPVEEELAKVGLQLVEKDETKPSLGFSWSASKNAGGANVTAAPGKDLPVQAKDVIVAANGVSFAGLSAAKIDAAFKGVIAGLKTGDKLQLQIKHEDAPKEVDVTLVDETKKVKHIEDLPTVTADQKAIREGWMFGTKGRPKVIQDPS